MRLLTVAPAGKKPMAQGPTTQRVEGLEGGRSMTSVGQRIKGFLNSPQGRKMIDRGRREAAKPGTQAKLRRFAERMTGGSSGRR